ncbi:MAG: thiosulfate oxidation carrier complex protein SoxZ [Betaproteobacteria bacterium]
MARTLITVPSTARRDEIIDIRVLIQHPMETGYRRSSEGAMLSRNLIRRFTCVFEENGKIGNGVPVFSAMLYAAVAANPFLMFHARVTNSGTFIFNWEGDNGFVQSERALIKVT